MTSNRAASPRGPLSLVVAFLTVLVSVAPARGQEDIPGFREAHALLERGAFREAATAFEEIIRREPGRVEPYVMAAQASFRIRRFNEAAHHLRMARQFRPDDPRILYDLGANLYNMGQWSEALLVFRELEALTASDPTILRWQIPFQRGVCAENLDLVPEALEALTRGAAMAQAQGAAEEAQARWPLAGLLFDSGRTESAVAEFERMVRIQPSKWDNHYYLGLAYLKLGKLTEAERALNEARRRNPDSERPLLTLGSVHERKDDLLKAQTFYQLATEKNPLGFEPWYALRQIHLRQNNLDEAERCQEKYEETYAMARKVEEEIQTYHRRVALDPRDKEAYLEHALLLIRHGPSRIKDAQEKLQQLLAVDPDHELGLINLAQCLAVQGNLQAAVYELHKLLERDPDHPIANLECARALIELRRFDDAWGPIQRAVQGLVKRNDLPRHGQALKMLAGIAQARGKPAAALPHLVAALSHAEEDIPALVGVLELLAWTAFQAGEPNEAIVKIEQWLPLVGPNHPSYKTLVGFLLQLAKLANDAARIQQYDELLATLK
jgi:tetratricopeptide (TPR) repeat protein